MWRHPILKVLLVSYIVWGAWHWNATRPIRAPDGVLAEGEPQQTNISDGEKLQMGRWTLTVRATYQLKARVLARETIISHSANTHVIPQTPAIARILSSLRPGEVVVLSGELVDAVRDDGRWIKTSLVRTDTGAGACEVMLVTDVIS